MGDFLQERLPTPEPLPKIVRILEWFDTHDIQVPFS